LDGSILLLGVGHDANTSLHLAEARFSRIGIKTQGGPILSDGQRVWQTYQEYDINSDDFPEIGHAFSKTGQFSQGNVGAADSILVKQRPLVDFAVRWMEENR
jgi:aminoglycoside 3-N-acetyltransferase